jgi:Tfp pilus assembly protein PilN
LRTGYFLSYSLFSMRTNLNLSRQPYTNRRLFWICLLAVLFAGLSFAFWTATGQARVASEINELKGQITAKQASITALKEKAAKNKVVVTQTVLTEEQKYQLASARQLIAHKTFSWNSLLSDIEKYVPKRVRILSIKIVESAKPSQEGTVLIEIVAAGETPAQMTEMMTTIEGSSGKFTLDQADQQQTAEDGTIPFSLKVLYKPLRGGE